MILAIEKAAEVADTWDKIAKVAAICFRKHVRGKILISILGAFVPKSKQKRS